MKTWKKLFAAGSLTPQAAAFAGDKKPAEELYDLKQDPHEVKNLVGDPKFAGELKKHRAYLASWIKETGDKGQQGESVEGLLQVMYRCINPEYEAVRKKYGELPPAPRKKKQK